MFGLTPGYGRAIKWGGFALLIAGAAALSGALVNSHWQQRWLNRDAEDLKAQLANARENSRINAEWASRFHAIQVQAITDQKKREATYEKTIADYRNGSLRLRKQFTCYRDLSEAAAGGRVSDGAGDCGLSAADVEFLIRFSKEANRLRDKVTSLQDVLSSLNAAKTAP